MYVQKVETRAKSLGITCGILLNNLNGIGLAAKNDQVDQPTFQAGLAAKDLGLACVQNNGLGGMTTVTLFDAMPPLRIPNPSHFDTPEDQGLVAKLKNADSGNEKQEALNDISNFLLDQQWAAHIVTGSTPVVAASTLHGVQLSSGGPVRLEKANLTK